MTTSLSKLRTQIDELDRRLVALLVERDKLVQAVGELKTSDDEILAPERQREVYESRRAWAADAGLDPDFVERLYRVMIEHFIAQERQQLAQRDQQGD